MGALAGVWGGCGESAGELQVSPWQTMTWAVWEEDFPGGRTVEARLGFCWS